MLHPTMKRLSFLLIVLLSVFSLHAQDEVKDKVVSALGSGNAPGLAQVMVANVDLTLPTASDFYSKAQAEQILRKFFEQHAPKGMTIEHEGTSHVGDSYYIGTLRTANGDFRVTFFLKKPAEAYQLKQLRIETGKADR
mgnify:CR=1 FL=1